MTRFRIRRRPDGVIELRRPSLRDSEIVHDAAVLVGLLVGCGVFICALAAALVTWPLMIAVTVAFSLPGIWACVLARSLSIEHTRPPTPPNHAA